MKNSHVIGSACSNRFGRILLMAMEEIIGRNGVNAVLNQAKLRNRINNYPKNTLARDFQFDEVSRIHAALEASYGVRGGRGLSLRIGRACFKHVLREFGPDMDFSDLAFRLLPIEEKISMTADILADIFNRYSDQHVEVKDCENRYTWVITNCPFCWGRQTEEPICLMIVGMLQEALYWVSSGKIYNIEEVECIATGASACVIEIEKQPLD